MPILVKDLCAEVEGLPIREGSDYLRDVVSTHDQEYVARLRRAGFVVLGKTSTPEFGMAPTVEPLDALPTANPWDTTLHDRRLERRFGRRGRQRDGPGRARERRRRLAADPGLVLRPVRLSSPRGGATRSVRGTATCSAGWSPSTC